MRFALATLCVLAVAGSNVLAFDAGTWPRERLLGFARELSEFVFDNHVVTDPARKTFGMTYEFWKEGKKVQEFGLDSMHDGAWLMSALVVMQRADPSGDWLARAQQYQVPFYTNLLLNSDRLFPAMQPTNEDKKPFAAPVKGWAPRGWDDGLGFTKNGMKPLEDSYFTASNHLSQDLADALLNVWLTTRDPRVAEALGTLRSYKREYFGPIGPIEVAAAVALGEPPVFDKYKLPVFSPDSLSPYFTGLFAKKEHSIPAYDDALAWQYRQATAQGEVKPEFAWHAAGRVVSVVKAMELYCDTRPWRDGEFFFDIARHPTFVDGRLDVHASDSKLIWGARGVQLAWIGAAVLPTVKTQPWAKSGLQHLAGVDVPARLEQLALGSIDYWHGVWKEAGVIPSGWHRDDVKAGGWTLSDAGNYAHLLHCIACVLMARDGMPEWQRIKAPAQPLPASPLPASVLKAQGLQ